MNPFAQYQWPGGATFSSNSLQLYFKPWNQSPYTAKACVNQVPSNSHINIEIGNLNPNTGFVLNPNDCNKELQALTTNIRGGEAQNYGWYFRYGLSFSPDKIKYANHQWLQSRPQCWALLNIEIYFVA